MFKIEEMVQNLLKHSFFLASSLNSKISQSIWGQNGKMRDFLTIQGQR